MKMGNIELKLNISRLDLILVGGVVLIATILFLAFITWLVRSARQNKSLKSIDSRLATNLDEKARDIHNTHTIREYVYIDQYGNKTIRKENIEQSFDSSEHSEAGTIKPIEEEDKKIEKDLSNQHKASRGGDEISKVSDMDNIEEEQEVDVMAEIQKMLKTTESYQMPKLKDNNFNVGKSGKKYSREDIESIIKD